MGNVLLVLLARSMITKSMSVDKNVFPISFMISALNSVSAQNHNPTLMDLTVLTVMETNILMNKQKIVNIVQMVNNMMILWTLCLIIKVFC